ncbi:MAG: hypothetical protein WCW30_05010 [Candidatus Gracilibacteria bacterium]|jgi:hypothetical protein
MNNSISKILFGFSLGGITTFIAVFIYLNAVEYRINVPGELQEVLFAISIPVIGSLLLLLIFSGFSKKGTIK